MTEEKIEYTLKHFLSHLFLAVSEEHIALARQVDVPIHVTDNFYLANVFEGEPEGIRFALLFYQRGLVGAYGIQRT